MVLPSEGAVTAAHPVAIQRRVGYVLFGAALAFAAANLSRFLAEPGPFLGYMRWIYGNFRAAVFNIVLGVLVLASSRVDHVSMRVVQVVLFLGAGVVLNLSNQPWDFSSIALFVYGVILAAQYSLLRRHLVPKLLVVVGLAVASGVVRGIATRRSDLLGTLVGVAAGSVYLLLLWIAFAETIRAYLARARELELERRKDSVFVRFGKNVAGLVHNLRNLLTILFGLNELIRRTASDPAVRELVQNEHDALDRMAQTIERILSVVKAKQDTVVRAVDLNELLEGVADFLATDLQFKRGVRLHLELSSARPAVNAQPLELCEVVENLVKNSWESLAARTTEEPRDIWITSFSGTETGFAVRDSGPGIPGLEQCSDDECRRFFQIGKSTKTHGTGLGVPFILEAARTNGWSVRIRSSSAGTETVIVTAPAASGGGA